jgi:hypothetical protein
VDSEWTRSDVFGTAHGWVDAVGQGQRAGGRTPFRLLGLPAVCWRCQRPTTALVGLLPADGRDVEDLITCAARPVLAVAAAALSERARQASGVGVLRPRFSRTAGHWYLSNGCVWCDALLGDFYLYTEHLPGLIAERGLAGLTVSPWSSCPSISDR